MTPLRIGTRGSLLALAQARAVAAAIECETELVEITTAGDVDRARGDKSRWTGALEAALLAGDIDLAVHSAKDVPGELAEGTAIVAAPRRADALAVGLGQALPAAGVLVQQPVDDHVAPGAQRRQRREHLELAEPASEGLDLLLDDPLGAARLGPAHLHVQGPVSYTHLTLPTN